MFYFHFLIFINGIIYVTVVTLMSSVSCIDTPSLYLYRPLGLGLDNLKIVFSLVPYRIFYASLQMANI